MISNWDEYGRICVDVTSSATALGFAAVKGGTRFGFRIARGIVSTAAQVGGTAVDYAVFGGSMDAGHVAHDRVAAAVDTIESLALAPILVGECVASTSLVAVASSLSTLQTIFPDRNEASFSLRSFVKLAHREWNQPAGVDGLPMERFCAVQVTKGLVGWATLQGMTTKWQEEQWFKSLREINLDTERAPKSENYQAPQVHVTTDVIYPDHSGQIITADIGQTPLGLESLAPHRRIARMKFSELKAPLRRYSQLVLAGYGGASLMFFGAPLKPSPAHTTEEQIEEASLIGAINAAETDQSARAKENARGDAHHPSTYSWWNVLMGRHDDEIFSHFVKSQQSKDGHQCHDDAPSATFHRGSGDLIPRFWVLTDHSRREVVLVLRGTMSINELAVDLTCEPAEYTINTISGTSGFTRLAYPEEVDLGDIEEEADGGSVPRSFRSGRPTRPAPTHPNESRSKYRPSEGEEKYEVHGGMLKMARAMGGKGMPVHVAVRNALRRNQGYNLVITGHSLGAGVAGMLALMWADPRTCLTHRQSGFPLNRVVSAYCYAPPCLTDVPLSKLVAASGLITSFVYSHDVVARLSLGSIRDLQRACTWLCQGEKDGHGDGYSGIAKHALKLKAGLGDVGSEEWFLAVRKTLEANMHMTHLYPPGRVFWAMHDADLHPSHRIPTSGSSTSREKLRLFEVLEVDKVFTQILFAKDMLSSHWPHQYDRILHELV